MTQMGFSRVSFEQRAIKTGSTGHGQTPWRVDREAGTGHVGMARNAVMFVQDRSVKEATLGLTTCSTAR